MAYTTINKPSDYFNTKLYTGNGTNNTSITGVGFQPDLLWIKDRTNVNNHSLQDAVRGAGYNLQTNTTNAQGLATETISSFDTDGWTMNNGGGVNGSGASFVAWNWLAGGTASTNNDGDNACSLSANATAGFSISTHTVPDVSGGQYTIGHGLGKKPKLVITKHISTTGNFQTYFEGIGTENQQYLQLNSTDALVNYSGLWGNGMTTSVVGLSNSALSPGTTAVTYCFSEIRGYSKFGQYTGNGSTDGTFVYTGFKPAFVIGKRINAVEDWYLFDGTRDDTNPCNKLLYPNGSNAEYTLADRMDFLSNGFKQYNTDSKFNGSGDTYIYMAFAEAPLVGSNNVPATAR